jgi:hypothetical protein
LKLLLSHTLMRLLDPGTRIGVKHGVEVQTGEVPVLVVEPTHLQRPTPTTLELAVDGSRGLHPQITSDLRMGAGEEAFILLHRRTQLLLGLTAAVEVVKDLHAHNQSNMELVAGRGRLVVNGKQSRCNIVHLRQTPMT